MLLKFSNKHQIYQALDNYRATGGVSILSPPDKLDLLDHPPIKQELEALGYYYSYCRNKKERSLLQFDLSPDEMEALIKSLRRGAAVQSNFSSRQSVYLRSPVTI
jgi:hypothetical protein